MKKSQRGFITPVIIVAVALLVIGGGVYFYSTNIKNNSKLSAGDRPDANGAITDISGCDSKNNADEKNYCYDTLAQKNLDSDLCLKINNFSKADLCYVGIAGARQDISLCSKVTNTDTKNICFGAVAVAKKDTSLCDLIVERPAPYGGYKDLCYKNASKSGNIVPVSTKISYQPFLTVLYPNGGETVKSGNALSIRWNAFGLTSQDKVYVSITDYSTANFDSKIINAGETLATQGLYSWVIPPSYKVGSKYKISVYTELQKYIDSSDNYFSITK